MALLKQKQQPMSDQNLKSATSGFKYFSYDNVKQNCMAAVPLILKNSDSSEMDQ